MKHLKAYNIFESIEDGLDLLDTKEVFEPYINWNMIYDLKDLALEYLDTGFELVVRIRYNIPKDVKERNDEFGNVENVWTLCYTHQSDNFTFLYPSSNVYDLEPIDKNNIEYFITLVKDYYLHKEETNELVEEIKVRYPELKI